VASGKMPGILFDRVRFDELAEDLENSYRIEGRKSMQRLQASLKKLKIFFEGMPVPNIDTSAINRYIMKRQAEGAAPATINRELSALKRMLNLGCQATPPKVALVPKIPHLRENNTRQGFFELSEFNAIRDALPEHLKGIATIGYRCGCRLSEITSLKWAQVDLKAKVFRLEETKNDEPRIIPMDSEVEAVFRTQRDRRRELKSALPWVFLNANGKNRVKRFDKAWATACKAAGVPGRLFHDLRRSAVRNLTRAGISEAIAMRISGHRTRSVFSRYNIVNENDLQQAVQQQAHYLEGQNKIMGKVSGKVEDIHTNKRKRSTVK
jgi:integrase